ncbi:MAG: Flp pilus assembly protein CpaB [Myxococcaceae bacterium]
MKTDYLWDRSGQDAELEGLELTMSALAYDGDPPVLPVSRVPFQAPAPTTRPSPPLAPVPVPKFRPGAPWKGRFTPLALALGLMFVGFGVAFSALQKERADVRKGWNLVPVLVASVDLSEGTVVTMEQLSQRSVPEQFVTSSVVKPDSASYVIGQKIQVNVSAGDPLLWSQFESSRAFERLASKILKRARGLSVSVTGVSAVGGWIRPNDHVDVIGTFKDPLSNEQVAVTLMQNVQVIATGKITGTTNVNLVPESDRAYNQLTVMVLPEEAEILTLAGELGALTFTLRNEDDIDVLDERGRATISTLLSGERTKVLAQKRYNTIQVIRGTGTTQTPTQAPTLAK